MISHCFPFFLSLFFGVQGYIEAHVAKVAGVLTQFKTGMFPLLSPAGCSIFTNSSVFVEIII